MNTGNYGHSICAVVYEGAGHPGCQFSFTCNGDLHRRKDARAWSRIRASGGRKSSPARCGCKNATGGATNIHAISVTPGLGADPGKDHPDRQPHLLSGGASHYAR